MFTLFKSPDGHHHRLDTPAGSIGLFHGRTNYLTGKYNLKDHGFEFHTGISGGWRLWRFLPSLLFTWHFGFGTSLRTALDFSGSIVEPYHSWTLRVLGFGVGGMVPNWIQRKLKARSNAKIAAQMAAMEEFNPNQKES